MPASLKITSSSSKRIGVFISHRGADTALAEQLAKEIRAAGYGVWLDVWKIDIGNSIIGEINAGLNNVKYLVLCYSESGVLSPGWDVSGCLRWQGN